MKICNLCIVALVTQSTLQKHLNETTIVGGATSSKDVVSTSIHSSTPQHSTQHSTQQTNSTPHAQQANTTPHTQQANSTLQSTSQETTSQFTSQAKSSISANNMPSSQNPIATTTFQRQSNHILFVEILDPLGNNQQ